MIRFLQLFTETIGWLRIALSPFLIALLIGAIIYFNLHNTLGVVLGIGIAGIGLIIGIVWATRVWKKQGTVGFVSRVNASPEYNRNETAAHVEEPKN